MNQKLLSVLFEGEHVSLLCGDTGQNDGVCCSQRGLRWVGGETVSQHVSGERETQITQTVFIVSTLIIVIPDH